MFTFKKTEFQKKIDNFIKFQELQYNKPSTSSIKKEYLEKFAKYNSLTEVGDIEAFHIMRYGNHILATTSSNFQVQQNMKTIRSFIRFIKHPTIQPDWIVETGLRSDLYQLTGDRTRDILKEDMNKDLQQRNKELVKKRKKDPIKWSFRNLAKFYGISGPAVWEVYHRYESKY